MTSTKITYSILLMTTVAIITAGCSDSNNPLAPGEDINSEQLSATKPMSINMQMASTSDNGTTSGARLAPFTNTTIELNEAKFLVKRLKVESTEDDSLNFLARDLIVDLPLDGSPFILSSDGIPNGIYEEFKVQVNKSRGNQTPEDPDFIDGDQRFSIVIKGTKDGNSFIFRSDENFNLEFEFNPPMQITDSTTSVTIDLVIDAEQWFVGEDGSALDPNNPDDFDKIEDNIEDSFEAREEIEDRRDRDRDEDDRKAGREFEQQVVAVDLAANTFTLRGNISVEITDSTAIRRDGDLFSLQEVQNALDRGALVEAEGRARQQPTDSEIDFTAHVVKFELEDDEDRDRDEEEEEQGREFEDTVSALSVADSTFTLTSGTVIRITSNTKIRNDGDFKSLEEVERALDNNVRIEAEGRAKAAEEDSDADLIALAVKFESDDD